jgi:hypothetical protein
MYESIKILKNKGVFTENTITDYLASSWIGEARFPVNEYLKESQESWITTIKPGLRILVNEITKEINSDCRDKGDYVCAIDSLTLKIEGCIRDACRRLNIPTVKDNGEEWPEIPFRFKISSYANNKAEDSIWSLRVIIVEDTTVYNDKRKINTGLNCTSFDINKLTKYLPKIDLSNTKKEICISLISILCDYALEKKYKLSNMFH